MSVADAGMGTLQLLTVLLRMTSVLYDFFYSSNQSSIIIFEEPELNIHPALQSKLADLFYEVHCLSDGKINIVVETHSEYVIRRSQVLVAENKLETQPNQNPFKIYYFNDEGDKKHYKIDYDEDGILKKNFGNGFFDEASSNTLKLLRLKKAKLN
jgi:predicted ATPase